MRSQSHGVETLKSLLLSVASRSGGGQVQRRDESGSPQVANTRSGVGLESYVTSGVIHNAVRRVSRLV